MGQSYIRIPRICEHCGKTFEAKQIRTRFCSQLCAVKAAKAKKQAEKNEQRELILQMAAGKIADIQTRPYITVAEATQLFGISKDTIRRLIRRGKLPAVNLGERLTRISRQHIEAMFQAVPLPTEEQYDKKVVSDTFPYNLVDCYTINEIAEQFKIKQPTASLLVRKHNFPAYKEGRHTYVPKIVVDEFFSTYTKYSRK